MLILGAHTIDNGGIHMAVRRAARSGMRALQVFTAKPQFYNEKISVRPERVERFKAALAETDIRPEHIVAHAAYVLSVATPDDAKYGLKLKSTINRSIHRAFKANGIQFPYPQLEVHLRDGRGPLPMDHPASAPEGRLPP